MNVLGSQVFGRALMESCVQYIPSIFHIPMSPGPKASVFLVLHGGVQSYLSSCSKVTCVALDEPTWIKTQSLTSQQYCRYISQSVQHIFGGSTVIFQADRL